MIGSRSQRVDHPRAHFFRADARAAGGDVLRAVAVVDLRRWLRTIYVQFHLGRQQDRAVKFSSPELGSTR